MLPYLEHIYLNYHRELMQGQKQLIARVLARPPGLFRGIRPFQYEIFDIPANDISVLPTGPDRFALHALGNQFALSVRAKPLIWPFDKFQISFSGSFETLDSEGTRSELIDYCLLYLRAEHTNQLHTAALRKVLRTVTCSEPVGGYREWLQAQLTHSGYANETDWLSACLTNSNPSLVHHALEASRAFKDDRIWSAVRRIIVDRTARPDVRAHAIRVTEAHPDRTTLLALTEILNDQSPAYRREYCPQLSPDYPLADRMTLQTLRPFLEQTLAKPSKTIGQTALDRLRQATKRNLGPDAQKWKGVLGRTS